MALTIWSSLALLIVEKPSISFLKHPRFIRFQCVNKIGLVSRDKNLGSVPSSSNVITKLYGQNL